MKKLVISKKYAENEEIKKELGIIFGDAYAEADFINISLWNTARFRKIVHTIVDYEFPNVNNEKLHKEISENNFTKVIMLGLVEVEEK